MARINILDQGLFTGQDTRRSTFYGAGLYPSFFNQICKKLVAMGFKKAGVGLTTSSAAIQFLEPTILFVPDVSDKPSMTNNLLAEKLGRKYTSFSTVNEFVRSARSTQILDENAVPLAIDNIVFAHWYPRRNALLVYFNIFAVYKKIKFALTVLEDVRMILREVVGVNLEIPMSSERIAQMKKLIDEQLIKEFTAGVTLAKINVEKNIQSVKKDITYNENLVVATYRKLTQLEASLPLYEKMLESFEKDFREKLEELKKMAFVKKVELTSTGIEVYFGKISLTFKNKKTYAGDYMLVINPTIVTFKNIDMPNRTHQHPHISGGHPCLGTASNAFYKALGQFRLKELVFLAYQFLNTYSDDNPYIHFGEWDRLRKAENKFDENGNLLVKGARVVKTPEVIVPQRDTRPVNTDDYNTIFRGIVQWKLI